MKRNTFLCAETVSASVGDTSSEIEPIWRPESDLLEEKIRIFAENYTKIDQRDLRFAKGRRQMIIFSQLYSNCFFLTSQKRTEKRTYHFASFQVVKHVQTHSVLLPHLF